MCASASNTRRAAALLAGAWLMLDAMAGDEAVYQRVAPDGTVSLTNVPDTAAYSRLVSTPQGAAAAPAPATKDSGAKAGAPLSEPSGAQPLADKLAPPPAGFQATLPDREAIRDAAAAAARTAGLAPETTQAMASVVAGQALQDAASAGSASDRMRNLYQATQSANSAQRNSPR